MKIFIVDDSAVVHERLTEMLRESVGLEVVGHAADVPGAAEAIRTLRPDAVILDVKMPGGSGIDLLRDIKAGAVPPRVMMFTNFPYSQYRNKCFAAGADFFFDKSTEFELLVETCQELHHLLYEGEGKVSETR